MTSLGLAGTASLLAMCLLAGCGGGSLDRNDSGWPDLGGGGGAIGAGGTAGGGGVATGSGGSVQCTDTGSAPDIVVTPTTNLVTNETGAQDSFTIVLSAQPTADVTVAVSSSDPTEAETVTASVTFTPSNWCAPQQVMVKGVDDALVDGPQNYVILTAAAVSSDPRYNDMNPANVAATNLDNDVPGVVITGGQNLTTSEAGGTASFSVALNTPPTATVTFQVSSSDLTEGNVSVSSLTFTASNWNVPQAVTIYGLDDNLTDGDVSYSVVLGALISVDPAFNGTDPADLPVKNTDNDIPGFIITPTSGLITNEAGSTAYFTVKLRTMPSADVVVRVTSNDRAEGTVSGGAVTLTFTPANWNTAQSVTVIGVDDDVIDGNRGYTIDLAPASSSDPLYNLLDPSNVQVTNNDNDYAGFIVTPSSGLLTYENGSANASFGVKLTARPLADVTIPLVTSDATEGTPSVSSLTFNGSNWNNYQYVTVSGVDDAVEDGAVTYTINLQLSISNDASWNGINPPAVSLSNVDDEAPQIFVTPSSGLVTSEGGGTAVFTVSLSRAPLGNVTLSISSTDTTEGTVSPTTVTFTPSDWTSRIVTVTGVDDYVADGNVGFTIVTGTASSSDLAYNSFNPPDVGVQNLDDDVPGVKVFPTIGLTTTEGGGTATFAIVLTTQPTSTVTIALSSDNTAEGTVSPASVSFSTSSWNTPVTVTVTGVNDTLVDNNVVYHIVTGAAASTDPFYNLREVDDVSVTNLDNDPYVPCSIPGMLDDMEDGDLSICPNQNRFGSWYKVNDGYGTQSFGNYALTGRTDSVRGAGSAGSSFSSWGAVLGFTLNKPASTRLPYNLTSQGGQTYTGITFWAKRNGTSYPGRLYVAIPTTATATAADGGTCVNSTSPPKCSDHYEYTITLYSTWTKYTLPFSSFHQLGWGYVFTKDFTRALAVEFLVKYDSYNSIYDAGYAWDFSIDDIQLY